EEPITVREEITEAEAMGEEVSEEKEAIDREVLESWNKKYEKHGALEVICPTCMNKGEFEVEKTEEGRTFTCPSCSTEFAYRD
ncbi:MAG: hypothetical protein JSV09_06890, partial [Thermoplasmata archaeon]